MTLSTSGSNSTIRGSCGRSMTNSPVLVAGAGIGSLSIALTLHQIGGPCAVFESVPEIIPLGVNINLQPNAVRELYELGFGPEALDAIGVQTREWALVGLNGNEVYSERRGLMAGYNWPQYSPRRTANVAVPCCAGAPWRSFHSYWRESDRLSQSTRRQGSNCVADKPQRQPFRG